MFTWADTPWVELLGSSAPMKLSYELQEPSGQLANTEGDNAPTRSAATAIAATFGPNLIPKFLPYFHSPEE